MVEFINSLYDIVLSGVATSLIIAALFYWYAVNADRKKDDFDKKYRESRSDKRINR